MKHVLALTLTLLLVTGLLFAASGCFTLLEYDPDEEEDYYEPRYDDRPISFFYELDYYGEWVFVEPHGWLWRPDVVYGWRPYNNGHWVWSGWDWVWVSYEPFGWAVYHYGFWTYDPVWGWLWLPDYEWSGARVNWAIYDNYIGWAPMPPPGYYLGDPWVHPITPIWIVVPYDAFMSPDVGRYHIRNYRPTQRYKSPAKVSLSSPNVRALEKRLGRSIRPVNIEMDDVRVGDKQYKKMILPPSQKQKVKRYEDRVSKKVFSPEAQKHNRDMRKKVKKQSQTKKDEKTRSKSSKSKKEKE